MGRYTKEDVEIGVGAGLAATSGASATGVLASLASTATTPTLVSWGLSAGAALAPVAPLAIVGGLVLLGHGIYKKVRSK